jgi:hypothetical protein
MTTENVGSFAFDILLVQAKHAGLVAGVVGIFFDESVVANHVLDLVCQVERG